MQQIGDRVIFCETLVVTGWEVKQVVQVFPQVLAEQCFAENLSPCKAAINAGHGYPRCWAWLLRCRRGGNCFQRNWCNTGCMKRNRHGGCLSRSRFKRHNRRGAFTCLAGGTTEHQYEHTDQVSRVLKKNVDDILTFTHGSDYTLICRGVAQTASAPRLGRGGRRFKSAHPD